MDASGPGMTVVAGAEVYAARLGLALEDQLGFGKDGIVWTTSRATALKVHEYGHTYQRERAAYERLRDCAVRQVRGHTVPRVIAFDDELLAIEMSVVQQPFLLTVRLTRPAVRPRERHRRRGRTT